MASPESDPMQQDLVTALAELSLVADSARVERMLGFLRLVQKWNRAYNLTSIDDPREMLGRHLLDSLSIVPHIAGRRVLDVGTGAGFPGVPLAIWFPERDFHLLDSNGKKMRFLFQARLELGLGNISLHHLRAEKLQDRAGFDCIVSRAVSSLGTLLAVTGHLLGDGGCMLAMKGKVEDSELEEVAPPYNVTSIVDLTVPGVAQHRQLVRITRNSSSGS